MSGKMINLSDFCNYSMIDLQVLAKRMIDASKLDKNCKVENLNGVVLVNKRCLILGISMHSP